MSGVSCVYCGSGVLGGHAGSVASSVGGGDAEPHQLGSALPKRWFAGTDFGGDCGLSVRNGDSNVMKVLRTEGSGKPGGIGLRRNPCSQGSAGFICAEPITDINRLNSGDLWLDVCGLSKPPCSRTVGMGMRGPGVSGGWGCAYARDRGEFSLPPAWPGDRTKSFAPTCANGEMRVCTGERKASSLTLRGFAAEKSSAASVRETGGWRGRESGDRVHSSLPLPLIFGDVPPDCRQRGGGVSARVTLPSTTAGAMCKKET